eukprot:1567214-Prymnesium_polylepis.1
MIERLLRVGVLKLEHIGMKVSEAALESALLLPLQKQFKWLADQLGQSKSEWLILIDGINELEDQDGDAPMLEWLSTRFKNAQIHVHVFDMLMLMLMLTLVVMVMILLLERPEVESVIDRVLHSVKKTRDERLVPLLNSDSARNPLFLTLLLQELVAHASHESLELQLTSLLKCTTVHELLGCIMDRLEQSTFGPLVKHSLQLLWAGREGLAQPELIKILNSLRREQSELAVNGGTLEVRRIEKGDLSDMLQNLAAKQLVICQHGRYTLRHDSVRHATYQRYFGEAGAAKAVHARLARYFE